MTYRSHEGPLSPRRPRTRPIKADLVDAIGSRSYGAVHLRTPDRFSAARGSRSPPAVSDPREQRTPIALPPSPARPPGRRGSQAAAPLYPAVPSPRRHTRLAAHLDVDTDPFAHRRAALTPPGPRPDAAYLRPPRVPSHRLNVLSARSSCFTRATNCRFSSRTACRVPSAERDGRSAGGGSR